MIEFRERQYGDILNTAFFFCDGDRVAKLDRFLVGDEVYILFDVSPAQAAAIDECGFDETRVRDRTVHVPCIVRARHHAMTWQKVGEFQDLGMTIVLEAATGLWEDVLKWIVLGTPPRWASTMGGTDD